jgi:4-alpha-glucanotransferase
VTPTVHPEEWGVATSYVDSAGRLRQCPPETVDAILESMGADNEGPPPPTTITIRTDRSRPDIGPGLVVTEDGAEIRTTGPLPPDLPVGYHRFDADGGPSKLLIVSPGKVPLPPGREWGFSAQVYATRSRRSWGIGDFADLRELGRWSKEMGAGFTLVNPLHAPTPSTPLQPSPYFPGSRCFLNPMYIAVEEVPGASAVDGIEPAAAAGRALNSDRRIDRDRVWAVKRPVLEAAFQVTGEDARFEQYRVRRGIALDRFATYCALAEKHGPAWADWPPGAESGVDPGRKRFHAWLQWVAEEQAASADRELGLVIDLAVGVDPNGPDSWIWRDTFAAEGMRVGAPPDQFNTKGQDWGLPPFDPWRLRQAGYAPWIEALRSNLAHGTGLRVDHVMGLFRLYWIPPDADARAGAYVYYPDDDLLDILALEAERAGAYVVGEDLGTVEDHVRRDLADRQVLTYRVWWFERDPPPQWPERAMGAVTTHDLPTVAGVLTGSDLQAQRDMGTEPNEDASAQIVGKLRAVGRSDDPAQVVARVYADLARAPCLLLTATLDDVLAVEERPNMPGTTEQWPNWSIALPRPLEDLEKGPLAATVATHLRRAWAG